MKWIDSKESESYFVKIYIAGPVDIYKQVCREYTYEIGLCVNLIETDYIYTGGSETGVIIELINYPRFTDSKENIWNKAYKLAEKLIEKGCQSSFTMSDNQKSQYYTRRVK